MIAVIISAAITSPIIEVINATVAVPFCCGFIFFEQIAPSRPLVVCDTVQQMLAVSDVARIVAVDDFAHQPEVLFFGGCRYNKGVRTER